MKRSKHRNTTIVPVLVFPSPTVFVDDVLAADRTDDYRCANTGPGRRADGDALPARAAAAGENRTTTDSVGVERQRRAFRGRVGVGCAAGALLRIRCRSDHRGILLSRRVVRSNFTIRRKLKSSADTGNPGLHQIQQIDPKNLLNSLNLLTE